MRRLYQRKKDRLAQKGHFTQRQLEDAFHQRQSGTYLRDVIFGANDGVVTTFAIVAGAAGAGLSNAVIIILGVANLIADGLSMGLGNFLGERSAEAYEGGQRQKEYWETEHVPDVERVEVRGILKSRYGFDGPLLDAAAAHLTADRDRWVEFMMREELDIVGGGGSGAARHGLAIFLAFVAAGAIPLAPFLLPGLTGVSFPSALVLAGLTFFTIGSLRSRLTPVPWWKAGFEVFLVGSIASAAAYVVGAVLEQIVR